MGTQCSLGVHLMTSDDTYLQWLHRRVSETVRRLKTARRDLAAQSKANECLVEQLTDLTSATSSPQRGQSQQSALCNIRNLAAVIEREVLIGMEAEAGLQLSPARVKMGNKRTAKQ